jgi:hypothetical protein
MQLEENFIRAVAHKLGQNDSDIRHRLDDFINYADKNKSKVLAVALSIHPLLNPFSGRWSSAGLIRFSGYMTQIQLYSLTCFHYFGSGYRRFDYSRQNQIID